LPSDARRQVALLRLAAALHCTDVTALVAAWLCRYVERAASGDAMALASKLRGGPAGLAQYRAATSGVLSALLALSRDACTAAPPPAGAVAGMQQLQDACRASLVRLIALCAQDITQAAATRRVASSGVLVPTAALAESGVTAAPVTAPQCARGGCFAMVHGSRPSEASGGAAAGVARDTGDNRATLVAALVWALRRDGSTADE
jgi:hypothetical protein